MYTFRPCSYEELRLLIEEQYFVLEAWKLVDPAYLEGLEIVEDSSKAIIALVYYDAHRNGNCEMYIQDFEVHSKYRRRGHGRSIIHQFLSDHPTSVELLPLNEDAVKFWKTCNFEGDMLGMYYYPEE